MFDVKQGEGKIVIEANRVMLGAERVNMRMGIPGLTAWIQMYNELNPVTGDTVTILRQKA